MRNGLKLSVVAESLSQDPRTAPRLARELGFAGIEYEVYGAALRLTELSSSGKRELKQVIAAQDQAMAALRMDAGPKGIGPGSDADQALSRIEKALDAAAGMGSATLCLDIGPLPAPPREKQSSPKVSPEQAGLILIPTPAATEPEPAEPAPEQADTAAMAQVDAVLRELGRRADRYGVMLAFRSELASFAAIERALKAVDCPWFGLDLDPVAVLRDAWDLERVFDRFGRLILHVRARDALAGPERRTKPAPLGQGNVNWEELLGDLEQLGYRGWLGADAMDLSNRVAGAAAALGYLKAG